MTLDSTHHHSSPRRPPAGTARFPSATQSQRRPVSVPDDEEDENEDREGDEEEDAYQRDGWPQRLPTSSRRYDLDMAAQATSRRYQFHPEQVQRIPPRRSAHQPPPIPVGQRVTEAHPTLAPRPQPRQSQQRRGQGLWWVILGALLALSLWVAVAWVTAWWTNTSNDWTYTRAFRTFSVDQAVGHNGDSAAHPSHFIVQNDHRHIILIELPANDAAKALIYAGPVLLGDGQESLPVTISFHLNAHTGRLDLLLHIQDQSYVFLNTGTKFVAPAGP